MRFHFESFTFPRTQKRARFCFNELDADPPERRVVDLGQADELSETDTTKRYAEDNTLRSIIKQAIDDAELR